MSESLWDRLRHGTRRLLQRPDWERFVGRDWAERIMEVTITDRFHAKQGRSTGRWILMSGGDRLAVYLKRHYRLPRWRGLLAALWPDAAWSPALEEARHLAWARAEGLPVPAVVAAGQYLGPWGRLQSFLAVEELTDMLPLHEAVPAAQGELGPADFGHWKRGLIAEMARLTRALHDRRSFHKDLYLCHFYVRAEDTRRVPTWAGRVHLIDLHRLARHVWTWPVWQVKDLAQLLYSSDVPGIGARDRLRFARLYGTGRWLRTLVAYKAARYRRHNEGTRNREAP